MLVGVGCVRRSCNASLSTVAVRYAVANTPYENSLQPLERGFILKYGSTLAREVS
jgi:hypothetical protein